MKAQTVVSVAVAATAGLHLVAIASSTADNLGHLIRRLGVCENSGCHWKVQVVDWTARTKHRIPRENDLVGAITRSCEKAVVTGHAVSIAHGNE